MKKHFRVWDTKAKAYLLSHKGEGLLFADGNYWHGIEKFINRPEFLVEMFTGSNYINLSNPHNLHDW